MQSQSFHWLSEHGIQLLCHARQIAALNSSFPLSFKINNSNAKQYFWFVFYSIQLGNSPNALFSVKN